MIKPMRSRFVFVLVGLAAGLVFDAAIAIAWTGPTGTAPNNNVGAPVNVGTTAQVKNGDFGANNISAFGNALLSGLGVGTGRYLNFDYTSGGTSGTGSAGYGIRDNAGTLEFKNLGGSWASLQSIVSGFSGYWVAGTGGTIYYNGGKIGIGTASPTGKLEAVVTTGTGADTDAGFVLQDANGTTPMRLKEGVNTAGAYSYIQSTKSTVGHTPIALNPLGGNVGIGTAAPGDKLVIADSVFPRIGLLKNGIGTWYLGGDTTAGTNFNLMLNATNMMTMDTSGHLGIGTVAPAAQLNIVAPDQSPWGFSLRNNTYSTSEAGGFRVYQGNNGMTHLYNNNVDQLDFGVSGVSIGSTSQYPSAKLTIDTLGAGVWAEIVNYNLGSPVGPYGIYSVGTTYAVYGQGNIYATAFIYASDARFKKNVKNLDQGLLTLMKLRPVSFTWNEKDPNGRNGKDDIGFIAQEVEKILPGVVQTDPATGYKSIDYPRLIPILAQAIQDQQKEIDDLKGQVAALKK